jgi:hypothetical protein
MPENKFSASGDSTPAIVLECLHAPCRHRWEEFRRDFWFSECPRCTGDHFKEHLAESAHATTTIKDEDRYR